MALFQSLTTFFRRHKRKLLFASAASISIYFLVNQFVIKRFLKFQNALKQELFVKEQIRRRFIQTQTDCYLTILALLPVLTKPVFSYLPTETITAALKKKKNPNREMSDSLTTENLIAYTEDPTSSQNLEMLQFLNKSKVELWHDLKIKSITRMLALIYSTSGLLLLTRLQLNILARKSYLELAIAMAGGSVVAKSADSFTYFVEQSYLSLSWWLLHHGWLRMTDTLDALVEKKFKDINPKMELSVETFRQILLDINTEALAPGNSELFLHLIFPVEYNTLIDTVMNTNPELVNELDNKDSDLVKLINETNFIISNDFTRDVYAALIQSGVDTLCDNILHVLNANGDTTRVSKLATFLAQLSIQSTVISDPHGYGEDGEVTGNSFMTNINDVPELDEFSASIYSNFE
ncbi:hypothetical protein PUMCH_002161 [Australozyma saopauloensis]|uniref:Peroxin-3 n=1 Tax=Australozyma saopauloensis TaxID=291208 RepID=A0AAX4H8G1_9ASCO|nr:hypothetical protein PUMCH_002161 [[Candida] saopauloensis]